MRWALGKRGRKLSHRHPPDPWLPDRDRELFVVGDVHLHRSSDPRVANDLAHLLDKIAASSPGAAVICNGDLFDLDRVAGEPARGLRPQGPERRLAQILARFPSLVGSLRAHLVAGGSLWLIAGNHDAELLLEPVQDGLRDLLGATEGNLQVRERLAWPDLIIEHGHQADPDACFYPDTMTAVRKRRLSAFPLACLITRLLLSDIPRFALMGDNHRPPLQVLLRVLRDYRLSALEMILRYPVAGLRIVLQSLRAQSLGDVPPSPGVSTMASPMEVARRLYLDRYFAVACGLPLAIAAATQRVPPWTWWPLSVLALALAVPPARRTSFALRDARTCERIAHAYADGGARLVVHGHTHTAFVERMASGATHANHGAFSTAHAQTGAESSKGRFYLEVGPDASACRLMMFAASE